MCTRAPKDACGGRGKDWTEAATNQENPEATRIQRRKAVDSSLDAGVCGLVGNAAKWYSLSLGFQLGENRFLLQQSACCVLLCRPWDVSTIAKALLLSFKLLYIFLVVSTHCLYFPKLVIRHYKIIFSFLFSQNTLRIIVNTISLTHFWDVQS